MASYDKQTEPLVDSFQPASSMYGISASELVDMNEVSDLKPLTLDTVFNMECT